MNKTIYLSPRLFEISKFIKDDYPLLDVGSDHGYLPIFLSLNGFKHSLYASENKKGPFNNLTSTVKEYGLDNKVICLFGNGLDVFKPDIKQVNISGMGGELIVSIINKHLEFLPLIERFILEPQKEFDQVRKFLLLSNYHISDEVYIIESGHYYPIIVAERGKEVLPYTQSEMTYGRKAIEKKDGLLKKYLDEEKTRYLDLMNNKSISQLRLVEIKKELEIIAEVQAQMN